MKSYYINFKPYLVLSVMMMIGLTVSCSSSAEVTSTYNDNQIVIDGSYNDWGTSIGYVKDDNIAFGFKNDNNNLYIVVTTSDRNKIMKILFGGLTTWIESDKGRIGIEFPLKPDPGEMQEIRTKQPDQGEGFERGGRMQNLISKNNQFQVIDKNDQLIYSGNATLGPDFFGKLSFDGNQLVDEMKIPISGNDITEKIIGNNVSKVEISFVTGEIEKNEERENRGSTLMTDEDASMNSRRNNGMGYGQIMYNNDSRPLEYNFNVTLSK